MRDKNYILERYPKTYNILGDNFVEKKLGELISFLPITRKEYHKLNPTPSPLLDAWFEIILGANSIKFLEYLEADIALVEKKVASNKLLSYRKGLQDDNQFLQTLNEIKVAAKFAPAIDTLDIHVTNPDSQNGNNYDIKVGFQGEQLHIEVKTEIAPFKPGLGPTVDQHWRRSLPLVGIQVKLEKLYAHKNTESSSLRELIRGKNNHTLAQLPDGTQNIIILFNRFSGECEIKDTLWGEEVFPTNKNRWVRLPNGLFDEDYFRKISAVVWIEDHQKICGSNISGLVYLNPYAECPVSENLKNLLDSVNWKCVDRQLV